MTRRLLVLLSAVLLSVLVALGGSQAKFFYHRGTQGPIPPPQFLSISMSCGSGCSFTSGTAGTVGTASATVSSGPVTGTWSLKTSGTDSLGTTCHDYTVTNNYLTINSSTGTVSNTTGAPAQSYPGVCPQITQAGITNSPYSTAFTFTGNSSTGVACTHGPNAPSIPGPAQKAGFTTCLVNADFTSSTTDAGGINFSNTATYIIQCGASYQSDGSGFDLKYATGGNIVPGNAPCTNANVAVGADPLFPSTQVLDEKYLRSQFTTSNVVTTLDWPGFSTSPPGSNLWQYMYYQITFRTPSQDFNVGGSGGAIPIDVWQEAWTSGQWDFEADFFEIQPAFNSGTTYYLNTNLNCTGSPVPSGMVCHNNGGGNFAMQPLNYADGLYHTAGYLITSDGSSQLGVCAYVDGGISTSMPYACAWLTGLTTAELSKNNAYEFAHWLGSFNCGSPTPVLCIQNDLDFYIRDFQIWTCSTPRTGPCFGTFVNSALDDEKHFAWLDEILSWVVPEVHADVFDAPLDGMWVCPDGRLGIHDLCRPPDIGKEWWKSCVAGRDDCVESDTAFIGKEGLLNQAKRGRGYCYTQQPYTCSPDGTVPK